MPSSKSDSPIIDFASQEEWNTWLAAQHQQSKGVWLKIAKKGSGSVSVSKEEAVETALCFGWIDGQLKPFDEDYWLVRFTPRRRMSKWSENNRTKALALIEQGRMLAAGLKEVEEAKADGRWDAAYASSSKASVPEDLQMALESDEQAKQFFAKLDSRNKYAIIYRINDAKRLETRATRIAKYVSMLSRGEVLYPMKEKA